MTRRRQSNLPPNGPYNLVKYDAACLAVKAASQVDEVQDFLNKAEAMRVYGRQIKNLELQNRATMIRFRAQHRLGELLQTTERNVGYYRDSSKETPPPKTLEELGVSPKQSMLCQQLAQVPVEKLDAALREIVQSEKEVTTAGILRKVSPKKKTCPKITASCRITEKNVEDTRCLSMAQFRLHYCGEKIKLLVSLQDDPKLGVKSRKVLSQYRTAFREFAGFIEGGLKMMD